MILHKKRIANYKIERNSNEIYGSSKDNKNINDKRSENSNKKAMTVNKNVNIYIPGENKNKKLKNNNYFVYRKKRTPINSPLLTKRMIKANNKEDKMKFNQKIKNYISIYNNINNNKAKEFINCIIQYIIKKIYLLHFPLFSYRLKILQKINIIENRLKSLYDVIKIKKKLCLYPYFHKFRNNIYSQMENQMISMKNNNNNINNENKTISNNTNNQYIIDVTDKNIKTEINNKKDFNDNLSTIKDNKIEMNEKYILLNRIINKKESNYNKNILKKYFSQWRNNIINNELPLPNKKYHKYNSNQLTLNKYNSNEIPKKKNIKVKKLKSARINELSHNKILKKPMKIDSFDSENINARKMKIYKMKVLAQPNEPKIKLGNNKIENYDNLFFIRKISNISKKISNKKDLFKFFHYWKKRVKENE